MEFKENIDNGVCDASVEGELTIYHVGDFKKSIESVIKKSTTVNLDLSEVSEIDTSCVQVLMQAKRFCNETEKEFQLSTVSPAVREVIEMFGLENHCDIKAAG